jgi:hypothetical protein
MMEGYIDLYLVMFIEGLTGVASRGVYTGHRQVYLADDVTSPPNQIELLHHDINL